MENNCTVQDRFFDRHRKIGYFRIPGASLSSKYIDGEGSMESGYSVTLLHRSSKTVGSLKVKYELNFPREERDQSKFMTGVFLEFN